MGSTTSSQPSRVRRWHGLLTAAVLTPPAILYALTLYPGVGGRINPGDSAKFQFLGKVLGVPHDPGYPQYMVLSHLWTRLATPLDLATHMNLLSAVFTLIGGGLIFTALRRLSGRAVTAALATWTLLLSSAVWTISTEAEVYSLHLAYVAGVLWAGVRWRETRQDSWLFVLIAIGAFSFGNHPLAIALLPAALWIGVATQPRILTSGRVAAVATAFTALTVSQYAYLWWRSNFGGVFLDGMPRNATLGEVWDVMVGGRFTGRFLLSGGFDELLQRGLDLAGEFGQLTAPALVLAVVGLVAQMRRDRVVGVFIALLGLAPATFVLVYQIADWGGYVAAVWVAVVTLAAVGAAAPGNLGVRRGVALVWLVALAWSVASVFETVQVRSNRFDLTAMLSIAEPGGIVLTYVEGGRNGYRERQLNNYYRYGLEARERYQLDFMLARDAFERRYVYLGDRPIYFLPGPVRRYVDDYQMDFVARATDDEPPIRYFVSGRPANRTSFRIEPVQTGGALVTTGDKGLVNPGHPIHLVVLATGDRRIKAVRRYDWAEDVRPDSHPALALLERVNPTDWVIIVTRDVQRPHQRQLIERIVARAGATLEVTPEAERSLVIMGQHSVPTGWRVLTDLEQTVDIALESGGVTVTSIP